MKPTVYIETTIPSYYCDQRDGLMHDILRTREWWEHERGDYECLTSPVVIEELMRGDYPTRAECLKLVEALPLLEVTPHQLQPWEEP
jgi:hypothetical protein